MVGISEIGTSECFDFYIQTTTFLLSCQNLHNSKMSIENLILVDKLCKFKSDIAIWWLSKGIFTTLPNIYDEGSLLK